MLTSQWYKIKPVLRLFRYPVLFAPKIFHADPSYQTYGHYTHPDVRYNVLTFSNALYYIDVIANV